MAGQEKPNKTWFSKLFNNSTPDKSTPDKSTPDKSTPDKSTPDKSTPDKSTSGKSTTDNLPTVNNFLNGNSTNDKLFSQEESSNQAGLILFFKLIM
jgi:hypothetical protein